MTRIMKAKNREAKTTPSPQDEAHRTRLELHDIPIGQVRVETIRHPGTPEEMENLLTSVEELGLIEPIVVAPEENHYILVSGYRRLRAMWILMRERESRAAAEKSPAQMELETMRATRAARLEEWHAWDNLPLKAKERRRAVMERKKTAWNKEEATWVRKKANLEAKLRKELKNDWASTLAKVSKNTIPAVVCHGATADWIDRARRHENVERKPFTGREQGLMVRGRGLQEYDPDDVKKLEGQYLIGHGDGPDQFTFRWDLAQKFFLSAQKVLSGQPVKTNSDLMRSGTEDRMDSRMTESNR